MCAYASLALTAAMRSGRAAVWRRRARESVKVRIHACVRACVQQRIFAARPTTSGRTIPFWARRNFCRVTSQDERQATILSFDLDASPSVASPTTTWIQKGESGRSVIHEQRCPSCFPSRALLSFPRPPDARTPPLRCRRRMCFVERRPMRRAQRHLCAASIRTR